MAYQLACKDLGSDCPFVAKSETMEDLMDQAGRHAKEVHSYTDAQLQDPKMMEQLKAIVKQV